MKTSLSKISLLFVLVLSMGMMQSCSDDPASAGEQAPSIPDLTAYTPDLDYFNQQKRKAAAGENFNNAALQAQTLGFLIQGLSALPNSILELGRQEDATNNDGVWEWEYALSQQGQSFSIRVTAEETSEGIEWNTYLSASGGNGVPALENYRYMSGTISADGTNGTWSIYAFEGDDVITFDWTASSETESTLTVDFSSGGETATLEYTRDGDDNVITITSGNEVTTIVWNPVTNIGYIDVNGQRQCWDANLNDTAC